LRADFYGIFQHVEWRTTFSGVGSIFIFGLMGLTATSRLGLVAPTDGNILTACCWSRSAQPHRYRNFLKYHRIHWLVVPLMVAHCWAAGTERLAGLGVLALLIVVNFSMEYRFGWTSTLDHCHPIGDLASYMSFPLNGHKLIEVSCNCCPASNSA
jgi:hypothetical protein